MDNDLADGQKSLHFAGYPQQATTYVVLVELVKFTNRQRLTKELPARKLAQNKIWNNICALYVYIHFDVVSGKGVFKPGLQVSVTFKRRKNLQHGCNYQSGPDIK